MDFHSMNRKQLQALCKKHKIPANLKNLEMAERLAAFHKERENQAIPAVVEEKDESVGEIESKDVVLSKKNKKVRFSPDHELIEFTREPVVKRRNRRNSVYHRESNCSVELVESTESEGRWGPTLPTGELKLIEAEVKQKKRGRKAVKSNDGQKIASAVDSFDEEDLGEGNVVRSGRVTRARVKMGAEVVQNATKRGRKSAKGDEPKDDKASNNVKNKEYQEELVPTRSSRVTRSRAQKQTEAPAVEEKVVRTLRKNKRTQATPQAVTDKRTQATPQAVTDDNGASEPASKDSHSKKEESSVADVADSSCMNSGTNAARESAEAEVGEGKRLLEVDVEEAIEQDVNADKNDAQAQEDPAENRSHDQSSLNADLKVAGSEVNRCVQPCLCDNNMEATFQTSGKDVVFESYETDYTHLKSTSELKTASSGLTGHHVENVAEENESFSQKDRAWQQAEAEVGSCSKDQVYDITPQEKENFSSEYLDKDLTEQGMSHGSPTSSPVATCNDTGVDEANLSAEVGKTFSFKDKELEMTEAEESECFKSSNSQETSPSTPSSVSETPEKLQKCVLIKADALANTNEKQGAWSNEREVAGNEECFSKSSEGKISEVAEDDYGVDEEASAEASVSDIKSCSSRNIVTESTDDVMFEDKVESEGEHANGLAGQREASAGEEATRAISRQSWTETELQKLFGASDEDDLALGDAFCQGSETKNMTMSKKKSTASNSYSLAKNQEKEMDGGSSVKCAKAKDNNMVFPSRFDADIDENDLRLLFATPVKNMTPYKTEVTEFQEIIATESMSYEKAQNAEHDAENNVTVGASLSDDVGDNICKGTDEVESFELPNTSTGAPFGAVHESCEALEDQLLQNKEESLQETNLKREEDMEEHVIPVAESSVIDEAIENNMISTSGSLQDLNKLENCADMLKTRRCKSKDRTKEELSDADIQISGVPDSSLDENILREVPAENSSDSDVAISTSSEKDETEKGTPPITFSKASPDCEDFILESDVQCEAKKSDERDGNPKSDELYSNGEVAVKESPFGYKKGQELDQLPLLESTSEEAKEMEMTTTPILEHGSFVSGAAPVFSSDCGKVQDAGLELEKTLCSGGILPDGGGDDSCGKMNAVESTGVKVTSTTVSSETEYDVCEASEKLIETTGKCQKETNFIAEDNEEIGLSCLYNEEADNDTLSGKENTNSLCGTPNNLEKFESCQAMLMATSPTQGLSSESRVYHNEHEHEMPQSSEAVVELVDAGLLKSNISNDSQNVVDEVATCPLLSPKASPVCDEQIQSTDTDDLDGAKICDKVDAEERTSQGQDCDNQFEIAGNIIASADESTAEMAHFSIQELHFEENVEDFKNDTHTISNLPASGCNNILEESDVDDTIKEYIESESSLSVIFESSSANLPSDILAHADETFACESSGMPKKGNDFALSDNVPPADCLDAENKAQEGAEPITRPTQASDTAANSPEHVRFIDEGATDKLASQKIIESIDGRSTSPKDLRLTMKKNARTILIHGTPSKLQSMADMKENAPNLKRPNLGDVTVARPPKRRALKNLHQRVD